MLVAVEERFVFFELGGIVALYAGGSAFFWSSVAARKRRSAVRGHVVHGMRPDICYAKGDDGNAANSKLCVEFLIFLMMSDKTQSRAVEGKSDARHASNSVAQPRQQIYFFVAPEHNVAGKHTKTTYSARPVVTAHSGTTASRGRLQVDVADVSGRHSKSSREIGGGWKS